MGQARLEQAARKPGSAPGRRAVLPCGRLAEGAVNSDHQDAQDAFSLLLNELRESKRLYEQSEDIGRAGIIYGLHAVIQFLCSFEEVEAETLAIPLSVLTAALSDHDAGIPSPLLQVNQRRGRKTDSMVRKSVRAYAALTLDLLMRTGLRREEAAKLVAAHLQKLGVTRHGGGEHAIQSGTVIRWRDNISGDIGKGFAAEIYEERRKDIGFVEGADPVTIRRDLLKRLERIVRAFRAADAKPLLMP